MGKMKFWLGIFLILGIASCQSNPSSMGKMKTQQEKINYAPELQVEANTIAHLQVEGMMCEKGCGALLRKSLYETKGVAKVEVNFTGDTSQLDVFYDEDLVSIPTLLQAINNTPPQRYHAKLLATEGLQ